MKYFGGLNPQNISRMWFREIFWGCTAPKYLTEPHPSNILWVYSPQMIDGTRPSNTLGVYSPQIFDRTPSVKYFGGLHPQNIPPMRFLEIFWGCTAPKYLMEPHLSNIWGL